MQDTVCLLAGQKRLEDEYNNLGMLPKANKINVAETIESIKEYFRSHYGVIRAPHAYIIRKSITGQVFGDYPKYITHDNDIISRMLHLPLDKNQLHNEQSAQSVRECIAEYKIDNGSVYNIMDQIFKDTDLYLYDKKYKTNVWILICIHMSNSISTRGMAEGHFMLFA